ncbi:hypothetical protein, partial [Rhizobium leguminosarum]|uniref:hypothetical protein n=1 Tax=Rhizobium leguminosarum TaxID=384 RepID=UPI003F9DEEC6
MAAGGAYLFWRKQNAVKVQAQQEIARQQELLPSPARAQETKELGWDDVTPIDMIGLEVGYRLIHWWTATRVASCSRGSRACA